MDILDDIDASAALVRWQALRDAGLSDDERIDVLMAEFFAPPAQIDCEYEQTLRAVATEMMEAA